ncbi:PAP/fibrillin family protein [Leptolyngbya sp. AN02str]|uniref:PAP/fibrillin family protein n=1 Tax=Leptolyngbya sp. AN02str TaxID=3423363 RepID=UPI003D312AB5
MLWKEQLLEAIAGKNRGLLATELDNQTILSAIARLEEYNPTPRPLEALDKLDGNWRLLFTTSNELLQIDRVPFFQLGQIYQLIRSKTAQIFNIAEVIGVPYLEGIVSVSAKLDIVSEKRANVRFERGVLGLQRILGYQSPTQFIALLDSGKRFPPIDFQISSDRQQGWLDVTYLDDNLRIGRGNEGNVFVLAKV